MDLKREQAFADDAFPGPRAFARWMLDGDRLVLRPVLHGLRFDGRAFQAVLFRQGCWQTELIALLPGTVVPQHRHKRVRSCDVALCGGGATSLPLLESVVQRIPRGRLIHRLGLVPEGVWHGGSAGAHGAVWLSFQQWLSGDVTHIGDDWEELGMSKVAAVCSAEGAGGDDGDAR